MSKRNPRDAGATPRKKAGPPKRLFNMLAEDEFFQKLDRLCEAERPPISRAHMLRKLVFEKADKNRPQSNGHYVTQNTRQPA